MRRDVLAVMAQPGRSGQLVIWEPGSRSPLGCAVFSGSLCRMRLAHFRRWWCSNLSALCFLRDRYDCPFARLFDLVCGKKHCLFESIKKLLIWKWVFHRLQIVLAIRPDQQLALSTGSYAYRHP
jgi:hypothetical protein